MNNYDHVSDGSSMDDFDYPLPAALIAPFPVEDRDAAKLLIHDEAGIRNARFADVPRSLPAGSVLVLNNSRVIEARIQFQKSSGGAIEVFCLEPAPATGAIEQALGERKVVDWICLVGGIAKWKSGLLEKEFEARGERQRLQSELLERGEESCAIRFRWTGDVTFSEVLAAVGTMPLPPYIKRKAQSTDKERYQTVFSAHPGSVAAPTAALHFTPSLLSELAEKGITPAYITLHVGAGTFKPVKVDDIRKHSMHGEQFSVSIDFVRTLVTAPSIIAVGTTSLRTLESLYWIGVKLQQGAADLQLGQWEAYELEGATLSYPAALQQILRYMEQSALKELHCRTSLLIRPGYQFRSANALITNFHQPRSTLLLLIAAFVGKEWENIYAHAMANGYRFLSYGDSSLLWRKDHPL